MDKLPVIGHKMPLFRFLTSLEVKFNNASKFRVHYRDIESVDFYFIVDMKSSATSTVIYAKKYLKK